jgi:hypothetical protein
LKHKWFLICIFIFISLVIVPAGNSFWQKSLRVSGSIVIGPQLDENAQVDETSLAVTSEPCDEEYYTVPTLEESMIENELHTDSDCDANNKEEIQVEIIDDNILDEVNDEMGDDLEEGMQAEGSVEVDNPDDNSPKNGPEKTDDKTATSIEEVDSAIDEDEMPTPDPDVEADPVSQDTNDDLDNSSSVENEGQSVSP